MTAVEVQARPNPDVYENVYAHDESRIVRVGFGWRVSLVAETIGSSSGVGYRLRQAADLIRTDQVFAWTLTLVIMMAIIEMGMMKPLENYLFRWKKDAEAQ